MISFNIKINLDALKPKMRRRKAKAQVALDNQIIKDSNMEAPRDIGTLRESALTASKIGKGKIVWDTPYARRLYYNPQYSFEIGGGLWFEYAKMKYRHDWTKIVSDSYKEGD